MNRKAETVTLKCEKVKNKKGAITTCFDPATGEIIAEYPVMKPEEVKKAVVKARKAQKEWASSPVRKRIRKIRKIARYITKRCDEMAAIISQDNGKTLVDAMAAEVVPAAMATSFYCKKAKSFLKERKLPTGNILFINKRSRIVRVPYGVVGIISPWNYPFSIPYSEVIMALLAGNAVILKAATETQMVGHIIKECIEAADLPKDIFTYINMPGRIAGDTFIDAGVDKLFFTGSVAVGKLLMKKASEKLLPVVLELGGNDPMIVCDDADMNRAAAGAVWAGMQNAGQSCGGVERIYVHKKVYFDFLMCLKNKVESLRIGCGYDFNSDIGAMTTGRQIKSVQSQINDAIKKGAQIFAQTSPPADMKGQFMPCTVLTEVDHTMAIMKEETFGPVIGVMPFKTIDEAIRLANDSSLGLTASVWSKNRSKAKKIARMISAGAVTINDHLMSHGLAETPWGGFKESGIGRTHGDLGFAEMTQPQVIVDDIMPFVKNNFWWHPFDKKLYNGLKGVIGLLYSRNIFIKIKSMFYLIRAFMRTFSAQ